MFPRTLLLALVLALAACNMKDPEYVGGTTAVGALLGYAATGDGEGAVRGAALGAAYGIASSEGVRNNTDDQCARYQNNPGAYSACKRGQEQRARQRQRDIERRAYRTGRGS